MIELADLRTFTEVVEAGGFNRAANHLGVAKSIVSRRIARLEADLGVRLLSRTTRGISPTDAGLEFKARCGRMLADLEEAREAVVQRGGGLVGRLRLSADLSFGVHHVAPVLAEMAKRHPTLEMDVSYSDRRVDLISEHFDAAIRIGALRDSSLVARRIAPVRSVIVATPDYLARNRRPSKPADLASHQCLLYSGSTALDWQFRSGARWIAVRPRGRLRTDSGEAMLQWALAGLGIAEAPSFMVADPIKRGALEPLLLDYPRPEYGIYVVRPPGSYVPGKVRALIDTLIEHFGHEPHWDQLLMPAAAGLTTEKPASESQRLEAAVSKRRPIGPRKS
jgi:DNA-binding transcriptional LysR family regulator